MNNLMLVTVENIVKNDRIAKYMMIGGCFFLAGELIYVLGKNNPSFNFCTPNGYNLSIN